MCFGFTSRLNHVQRHWTFNGEYVATTTAGRISNRIASSNGEHNTAQTVGNSNANNGYAKGAAMMGTRTVAVL